MSLTGENDMTSIGSKLPTVARIFMGAVFLLFGLNAFLQFAPMPPPPPAAGAFIGALIATGYLFPLIKVTEIVVAVLLLSGRFVPLALTVIAPILVNIVAFHVAFAPAGLAIPLVLLAAEIYLAWSYRDVFAPLLRAKATVRTNRPAERHAGLATAS
jgi:uncharacterized membrane protein YphA (DoxX/SURF4 family)